MKVLLDSHTLLWSIGKSDELSKRALVELKDINNDILISAISLWEIALKYSIGKLIIEKIDIQNIPEYCIRMGYTLIPLDPIEALNSLQLPFKEKHKDPFDRMLIYQCIRNGYTLLSKDRKFEYYKEDGLKYIW
ncbi:twitching motility protein PilT [Spirochaetia bacterium]|nr:twitching motility protein PilT [Spirochaetia bacterium]